MLKKDLAQRTQESRETSTLLMDHKREIEELQQLLGKTKEDLCFFGEQIDQKSSLNQDLQRQVASLTAQREQQQGHQGQLSQCVQDYEQLTKENKDYA